jgi:hypothetical protein
MRSLLVLEDALQQIAGHADVKRVASTRHDVCAIDLLVLCANLHQPRTENNLIRAWLQKMSAAKAHEKQPQAPSAPLKYASLRMTALWQLKKA